MDYPVNLLPKASHKFIDCDLSGLCLIRHSHLPNELILDEHNQLKNEIITSNQLPDLSTSLFGVFTLMDIKIKVTNEDYQCYCNPNIEVEPPVFEKDFECVEGRGYWSVLIESVNKQKVEYEDGSLSAICHIVHTPMKWNFWHFSMRWFINDINNYWHINPEYQTKSIRRKLVAEDRGLIKEFGKPILVSEQVIDESCYTL